MHIDKPFSCKQNYLLPTIFVDLQAFAHLSFFLTRVLLMRKFKFIEFEKTTPEEWDRFWLVMGIFAYVALLLYVLLNGY